MANDSAAPENPAVTKLYEIFLAGEYAAVRRLIDESAMAPTTRDRVAVMGLMAAEIEHFQVLAAQVEGAGGSAERAIDQHVSVFDKYHRVTEPSDWAEVLVKLYIGDGMVADFFAEMVEVLPDGVREVFREVLATTSPSDWARDEVRAAVAADPAIAAPLALWGRRLLGEAITHMQWVLAEDEDVTDLLFDRSGALAGAAAFFDSMAERHAQRMADMSLA
ncbi:hydroxylase [Gordonia iterans]|uniref:Hydroxylase n=1 Tax=Gordonia iterans TaxID=1004901 RepID=A0A2S0KID9_9ACTN|nr:ferritin-like fold-containing protein [Gordonia iterans]AVM01433.1 hydroxylase [Gordonia iterans]